MDTKSINKKGVTVGLLALALTIGVAGGTIMQVGQTNAQAINSTAPSATPQASPNASAPSGAPDESEATHVGSNGQREQLLTGDSAQKVTAAALAAVPGGTIQRVETEVDGNGVYEAHMTKSDGSRVTVFFDANFNVTSTQEGKGGMKAR